jgi:hypothetical protein
VETPTIVKIVQMSMNDALCDCVLGVKGVCMEMDHKEVLLPPDNKSFSSSFPHFITAQKVLTKVFS